MKMKAVSERRYVNQEFKRDLFITTKVWNDDRGYEETLEAFEKSLKITNGLCRFIFNTLAGKREVC